MAYHRTAVFKVHDPSGRKLRRVKKMQRRYSNIYCDILHTLKGADDDKLERVSSVRKMVAKRYFAYLIDGQPLKGAMRDGLVRDIRQSIDTYLKTPGGNFPAPAGTSARSVGELLNELLAPHSREEEKELRAELERKNETYTRPINFTRYRNNPIIRSDDGEKLWVAPHLQEREDGKTGALPPNGNSVRPSNWSYSTRSYHWKRQSNKETLPIELGRWHMHRFFREGTPKSSKVHVIGDDIYIYYSFEFEDPERRYEIGNPVMGIDRGEVITAAYAVVGSDGSILEKGSSATENLRQQLMEIDQNIAATQERGEDPGELWSKRHNLVQDALHRISNEIVGTASRYDAAIAFEDLENLSGLGGARMTRRQFNRLAKYVRYKAEEEALWAEVKVPPKDTSRTCPECGYSDGKNRGGRKHPTLKRGEFQCQRCNYEAHADLNAARVISIRALWQINGGKDGTGCETLTEYTKSLSQSRANQTEPQKPN